MKKIIISLFSLFLVIGLSNNAFACETCGCQNTIEIGEESPESKTTCDKKAKACDKSKSSCCKSSKKASSIKKMNKNNGFNYSKSNSYAANKKCCKSKTNKSCSKTNIDAEKTINEEIENQNLDTEKK